MMFLGLNIKGGGYMNSITDLLDLEDNDVIIKNIDIQGQTKVLTLETPPTAHFCPVCGFRMYSRGVKERTINHTLLFLSSSSEDGAASTQTVITAPTNPLSSSTKAAECLMLLKC